MASRWNPFLATCLVATGTKAAGYPQIWSFEEQCFPHHPAKWWHSQIGRETVTPSLIVSTATPMESSIFLIWCAGMVIRSGTTWHIARFWRHFPPQYYDCDTEFRLAWVQQKFIENQVRVQHVAQYLLHVWLMTGASGQVKNQSLQFSAPSSLPGQENAILKLCNTSSIYNCIHISAIDNLYFSVTRSQLLKLSILRCLSMILWMAFSSTTEGWATRGFFLIETISPFFAKGSLHAW